jgi:hypothetical protein
MYDEGPYFPSLPPPSLRECQVSFSLSKYSVTHFFTGEAMSLLILGAALFVVGATIAAFVITGGKSAPTVSSMLRSDDKGAGDGR